MGTITAPPAHALPARLADQFHELAISIGDADHEAATIIRDARERLRILSYNRYADAANACTVRKGVARRLRSHAGWRE